MEALNKQDLLLIKEMQGRRYTKNTMVSNSTLSEREEFKKVKAKLKKIAKDIAENNESYGPFKFDSSSGNPLTRQGNLNRVWSGIYKGAQNKQYAAQISFVINPDDECLDVGFFFGRTSSHNKSKEEKRLLEDDLKKISIGLSNIIHSDPEILNRYYSLIDLGFKTYSDKGEVSFLKWLDAIKEVPQKCQIIYKLKLNDSDIIKFSSIVFYVNQILFFMLCVGTRDNKIKTIPPRTLADRAKWAERLTQIGDKGELFVLDQECEKLRKMGLLNSIYPKQVSKESDMFGYDILSKDENNDDIYIEVKTTTRRKSEYGANTFFLSQHEYKTYLSEKEKYKLYRVYDIDNDPYLEELDIEGLNLTPDGYVVSF